MKDPQETAETLLQIVRDLVEELHPHKIDSPPPKLDSLLDQDLGFDSLGRVELLVRIEQAFQVNLPEQILVSAESPRDLLRAIISAADAPGEPKPAAASGSHKVAREVRLDEVLEVPEKASTLLEVLQWHVDAHPDRQHIHLYGEGGQEESITYAGLQRGAERIAAGLQAHHVEPGQAVAIMLPTGAGYLYSFFGILLAGGTPVPIYPPVRPSQIEDHLRRHAGILSNARVPLLITIREAKPVGLLLRAQVESLRAVVTVEDLESTGAELLRPVVKAGDIAFLQYTSGSTGQPKGVMLTHANLLANVRAFGQAGQASVSDVFVSWLPLYHDMGLIGAWFGSMYHAFLLVLMSPLAFLARPERWLQAIHRHRGSITAAPNFAYELCLRRITDEHMEGVDLSSLRYAVNGAEPVIPETIINFEERFAKFGLKKGTLIPVYGLAESTVGLALPPPGRGLIVDRVRRDAIMVSGRAEPAPEDDDTALRFVNCGPPLNGHQIKIVDSTGSEVGDRQEGNLHFRGPSSTIGYLRNPEETRKLFHGDWLDSGDLAYMVKGEVYITSRVKDVIIRAGRNIYPYELEVAVGEIEGIRKGCVAVFGASDPATGTERVVVLAETRETESQIRLLLTDKINSLAMDLLGQPADDVVLAPPHAVLKTSSGKIRRAASRALYEKGVVHKRQRALWWQIVRVGFSSALPSLRRSLRAMGASVYAAYWWVVLLSVAVVIWPAVVLVPVASWDWFMVRFGTRLILRLIGARLRVQGLERLTPGTAYLFVSNHSSYMDGLALVAGLPRTVSFVAKRELERQFLAGPFLRRIGTQFVERFDAQRGVDDVRGFADSAGSGTSLLVFPEGTFHRMPGLHAFHMGAFTAAAASGVPVVPIAIRGTREILRDETWFPRRGAISIYIGEPITPAGADWEAAIALRNRAREEILRHSGEPDLAHRQDSA